MSENNLFPRKKDIFQKSVRDVQTSVGRPSFDTQFQVVFSFGNYQRWLEEAGGDISRARTSGIDFKEKMAIMCTEAELPGTTFQTSLAVGHHQGIQEEFPNLRTFPPLNLTFYVDLDHVILEVLESWMTYINPISAKDKRVSNAYGRFNYPEDYKETIHVTKFERDLNTKNSTTKLTSYEFINAWPTNLTSMRVAYGESNVLRCSIQLAYDRFLTDFNKDDTHGAVIQDAFSFLDTAEIARRNGLRDQELYGNTFPSNSFGKKKSKYKTRKQNRHGR